MGDSADLQARFTAEIGPIVADMRRVEASVKRIENASKSANKAAKDHQATLSKTMTRGGQAASKVGGPAGSVIGRIASGFGIDGTMGRAAVGFALLGTAISAFSRVSAVAVERMQKQIDAEKDLAGARERGEATLDNRAKEGRGQRDVVAFLETFGGNGEAKRAGQFAKDHKVELGDAQHGFAATIGIKDQATRDAIHQAAWVAQRSGLGSFSSAAEKLASDPVLRASLRPSSDSMSDHEKNSAINRALRFAYNLSPTDTPAESSSLAFALGKSPEAKFVNAVDTATGIEAGAAEGDRALTAERIVGIVSREISEKMAPLQAETLKVFKEQTKQLDELRRLSEAQGAAAGLIADIFSPQGSFKTQMERLTIAIGNATLGKPGA